MSGTFWKLNPLEKPRASGAVSLAGVIHWCVVPSLIHG
jgi:hypothetical protein